MNPAELKYTNHSLMADLAELYNALPTLGEASDILNAIEERRNDIFSKIASLLLSFDCVWGLSLVHAHCTIGKDEKMLSRGDISQPEVVAPETPIFAERWLADGRPYEFSDTHTGQLF